MKVFVSSIISGMEEFRQAAVDAIEVLGHTAITAEEFAASPTSPRVACLQGVREADLVVLILGERYGVPGPPHGISPTHEEYREAKGTRPILAFLRESIEREPLQESFVNEVQDWNSGLFRNGFQSPDRLRELVTRSLHQHELSSAVVKIDVEGLLGDAKRLLQHTASSWHSSSPQLRIAVIGGPAQPILRPKEIEGSELADWILERALFGSHRIFRSSNANESETTGGKLCVRQSDGARICLNEQGYISISLPLKSDASGIPSIISEDVQKQIADSLLFASDLLEKIDSSQKLGRVVICAYLYGADYMAWRTKAEQEASPNSVTHGFSMGRDEKGPVSLQPPDVPRPALVHKADELAEDLTALLKRQRG